MAVKIGFIGAGRMAGAMIKGLIAKNVYGPEEIVACAPTKETRDRMTQETGIRMFDKASDIAGLTDVLVLAIKPKNIAPLFLEEGVELTGDHLLISIAAGVKIKTLKSYVPDSRIVRVMPRRLPTIAAWSWKAPRDMSWTRRARTGTGRPSRPSCPP